MGNVLGIFIDFLGFRTFLGRFLKFSKILAGICLDSFEPVWTFWDFLYPRAVMVSGLGQLQVLLWKILQSHFITIYHQSVVGRFITSLHLGKNPLLCR
jgi:hypothetical protein